MTTELTEDGTGQRASEAWPPQDDGSEDPGDLYPGLVENIPEVFYRYEVREPPQAIYLSRRVEELTGYPRETFLSDWRFWIGITHPDDRERVMAQISRSLDRATVFKSEYRLLHRSGDERVVIDIVSPWRASDGRRYVDGVLVEITERKRAEIEIIEQRERLRALSRRLVDVQEKERRSISRELHDEVGQLLTGLKLILEIDARRRGRIQGARLAKAQELVREIMDRVRSLSLDLRPAVLDDLGLVPALLWHFERFRSQMKVRVEFEHSDINRRFPSEFETAAYRIIQEGLTNVARHSGMRRASVRVWVEDGALYISVEDDGVGFDGNASRVWKESSGIQGMMERAMEWRGELTIDSSPGEGTCLTARLPLPDR